jgi:iron complex outermembrane receptor protein
VNLDRVGFLRIRGDYRYQSAMFMNVYQDPAVRQDGYGLVNAGLTLEGRDGHWRATLYGRNLTDERYAVAISRLDPLFGTLRFWGPPRVFGLQIGYRR